MNRRRGLLAQAREARIPIKRPSDRLTISAFARIMSPGFITPFKSTKLAANDDKYSKVIR